MNEPASRVCCLMIDALIRYHALLLPCCVAWSRQHLHGELVHGSVARVRGQVRGAWRVRGA